MFVVKHYRASGTDALIECERFECEVDRRVLAARTGDKVDVIHVGPGDSLFVEGPSGKTVYSIKPRSA